MKVFLSDLYDWFCVGLGLALLIVPITAGIAVLLGLIVFVVRHIMF